MSDDAIDLAGFADIDVALAELENKALERNALVRAGTKALQPVQAEAKRLVPVREGDLRDSLVIATGPLTREAAREEVIDKGAIRIYFGTVDRNGVPREFGSERAAAEPFARPAWESQSGKVLDTLAAELGPEVERTAARAARRRANRRD